MDILDNINKLDGERAIYVLKLLAVTNQVNPVVMERALDLAHTIRLD
jgi:hypothetical protein